MILIKQTKNIKEIKEVFLTTSNVKFISKNGPMVVVIFQAVLIFFIEIALLKNINLNVKFTNALYQINVYLIC